ncbi:hypothetical protein [Microbulbifer hydrolyticus]|uniref:DUF4350 domain-containing protein n=1 Tax=Microbulbifer hydrolyticus TaxID=48074 RepID=A0A6P1TCM9_9GAMM|nr:hypothetical protein [Microbulbifer hydrolyticus]MBB5211870.1 hypothetical protein [Microbulbifer hydrolyticus]QHQ40544.1 hypothetical protein GTQ55_17210 [Microbulbifer hydrolyticus]
MNAFSTICLLGLAASLWLGLRQRTSVSRRATGILLQCVIWLLVWSLFHPPALLPPEKTTALATAVASDPKGLPSPQEINRAGLLQITGDGVSRDALRDLPPVRLQHGEITAQPGWQVQWTRQLTLGEPLQLRVSLLSPQDAYQPPVKLTLQDPFGSDVDSALLGADSKSISLQAWPKIAGDWQYRVHIQPQTDKQQAGKQQAADDVSGAQDTDRSEVLPVIVREPQSPRVLLWLARPGFESAALARWLRQSGTPTQVVTQLAPKMQRRETFNGQELRQNALLAADSPFDLLVLDSRLWSQLDKSQRRQIDTLAQTKSLLWLVDSNSTQAFIDYAQTRGMPLQKAPVVSASYPGDVADRQPPELQLAGYQPANIRAGDAQLGTDGQVIYWGRVQPQQALGFAFFRNSYRWQTAGYAREFALLWNQLFERQLALHGTHDELSVSTQLPRVRQRLTVCSSVFNDSPPELHPTDAEENVAPVRGIAAGHSEVGRCHSYWPRHSGWHQVGETGSSLYVFAQDAWAEWQTALLREETAQMASARLGPQAQSLSSMQTLPLPWIALALMTLLLLTWWRERRSLR